MYEVVKGRKSYQPGNTTEKQMLRFISYLSQIQAPARIMPCSPGPSFV